MSGHSKWATIKRKKGAADIKRGALFTKLANAVAVAARAGSDPEMNFKLRIAIDKARQANVPKDTIERAISRGAGGGEGALEAITYEGFGPAGVAVIVETLTDNRNRAAQSVKSIFTKNGGSLAGPNSVMWMFDRKGVIRIPVEGLDKSAREQLQLKIIETGAEDIKEENGYLAIHTSVEDLQKVKENLEKAEIKSEHADLEYVAKELIKVDDQTREKIERLFEALDEDDDVQDFYTNADF